MATQNNPGGLSEEATISLQQSLYDPGYVNAMSHFYRGELGRIMVWRQRLDITTNWAITSSTAIITIAFSNRDVPHIIFFFNLAIVWGMLWIEARRYRFYDAFRARVRMLEAHFLVPMVMENREMLQGEWKKLVCEDLILPSFKIIETRGDRPAPETQLRVHFHPHHGGVDHENLSARHHAGEGDSGLLRRFAHRSYSILARRLDFRRNAGPGNRHHDLRR